MLLSKKQNIKSWSEEDRPREKLILKGKAAVSDAELLAILITSGTKNQSAVSLAKEILSSVQNNLILLSQMTITDLTKFSGIGTVKALSIIAALELGNRKRSAAVIQRKKITSSHDAFEFLHGYCADNPYESFWALLLNQAGEIIRAVKISDGGLAATVADPKRIFKVALENNAASIILCHNHPSGNVRPSKNDINLTIQIKKAGEFLSIPILDHIIIGHNDYYSFNDNNEP